MSQVENIDKTQLEKYLENPDHCPFCGSDAIEGNGIEIIFDKEAIQEMSCIECEASWNDVYKLSHIS